MLVSVFSLLERFDAVRLKTNIYYRVLIAVCNSHAAFHKYEKGKSTFGAGSLSYWWFPRYIINYNGNRYQNLSFQCTSLSASELVRINHIIALYTVAFVFFMGILMAAGAFVWKGVLLVHPLIFKARATYLMVLCTAILICVIMYCIWIPRCNTNFSGFINYCLRNWLHLTQSCNTACSDNYLF